MTTVETLVRDWTRKLADDQRSIKLQPYIDCVCDTCAVLFPVIADRVPAVYEECNCPTCDGRTGSADETQDRTASTAHAI